MLKPKFLLWIIPKDNSIKYISESENKSSEKLITKKRSQYLQSRSYLRQVLSDLLGINPLKVPLYADYGKIPSIPKEFGYISISHSNKVSLIGWSEKKIGVDIESNARIFNSKKLIERYFFTKEKNKLLKIKNTSDLKKNVLKYWVLKEAVIKLTKGKIAKDLSNWEIRLYENKAINKTLKKEAYLKEILYKEWIIGIASMDHHLTEIDPIICNMIDMS